MMVQATLQKVIKSYLYWQYRDDDNLQALVDAYNSMSQDYLDTFNGLNLPIYTMDPVSGALLDWVAAGLYGFLRPALPTLAVDDDLFRRVITWHFFKADGRQFTIEWLKRRIARFLFGLNGVNFNVDQTYRISVVMNGAQQVTVKIVNNLMTITGGAIVGSCSPNQYAQNYWSATNVVYPSIPEASVLEQAMASGILETPFQFSFTVIQGGFVQFLPLPQMPQNPQPQLEP